MGTVKRSRLRRQSYLGNGIVLASTMLFFLLAGNIAYAAMSSNSYKIPSDSINVGGLSSESGQYGLEDVLGEAGTGESGSQNYKINAGFLATGTSYLSLSAVGDFSLSPSINGVSGGSGDGSTTWTVVTDNPAGYSMTIRASTAPALKSANASFADYAPAGSSPDYDWSVAPADSQFGFTPEGLDIIQRYKDNGSVCDAGTSDTVDRCWDSLDTAGKLVGQRSTGNHPNGTATMVKVRAESGADHIQPSGSYSSTIEVTVLPL